MARAHYYDYHQKMESGRKESQSFNQFRRLKWKEKMKNKNYKMNKNQVNVLVECLHFMFSTFETGAAHDVSHHRK